MPNQATDPLKCPNCGAEIGRIVVNGAYVSVLRDRTDGLKTALERIARNSNEPWARDFARLALSSDRMSYPDDA